MSSCSALNICSTIYAKRPQKSQRPQLSKKISSGAMVIIIKMNHKTRHHYERLRSLAIKLFNKHPDKLNNFKNVVVKTGSFTALIRTNFIVFIYFAELVLLEFRTSVPTSWKFFPVCLFVCFFLLHCLTFLWML